MGFKGKVMRVNVPDVIVTPQKDTCSDTLIIPPPPPTPFYKIEEKFVFEKAGPTDRYNLYFIAFVVLGAGFHLPFNSFVAAVDYFMLVYDRSNMTFIVAATYTYTTCVAVFFNVILVNRVSTHTRITFGYGAFMFSLTAMAVLVAFEMLDLVSEDIGFTVTVIATFLTGLGCGVQEASYYGYVGMLPNKYTRAIMLGESFAGLVVSINRIVTKSSIESPLVNTIIFFTLSVFGEIGCVVLHRYIKSSPFVLYYENKSDKMQPTLDTSSPISPSLPSLPTLCSLGRDLPDLKKPLLQNFVAYLKDGLRVRLKVSKRIWKLMMGILQVYFVSLLLYPGVTSIVPSTWPDDWFPVILITLFNFFDFLGTLCTGFKYRMSEKTLLLLGLLRWLLIPILVCCVVPLGNAYIKSELPAIAVITILGFTTGYMGSTPMCAAAAKVPVQHRELSGNLMTMFMLLGLTLGSTLALALNHIMGVTNAEF